MRRVDFLPEKFGNLVIAENAADIQVCEDTGLPYLYWEGTDQELGMLIFRKALKKRFPHIKWDDIFMEKIGKCRFRTLILHVQGGEPGAFEVLEDESEIDKTARVSDVAESRRGFNCKDNLKYKASDLLEDADDDYTVDIDVLQELNLLPTFIGDIATAVRTNLASTLWQEGWNKRLHAPLGNMQGAGEQCNLIIIDISGSIPAGISATLLALMDTMKEKARADLIVTGSKSMYWSYEERHPKIQDIRKMIGRGNESAMFNDILSTNIAGKSWGNVIAFGDNDYPMIDICVQQALANTKVGKFWHYHTGLSYGGSTDTCGYAEWQDYVITEEEPAHDTSWCKFISQDDHR